MAHRWDSLLRCWLSINSWMSLHVCQLVRTMTPLFFFFFLIKSRKRRGEDGVVIERTSNISWRHISLLDLCDKLCRVSQSYRIRIKTAFICQGHRMHKETDLDNWCRNSDHKGSLVPSLWLFSVVALQHEWVFKVDVFCFGCDAFCGSWSFRLATHYVSVKIAVGRGSLETAALRWDDKTLVALLFSQGKWSLQTERTRELLPRGDSASCPQLFRHVFSIVS